MDLTIPCFDPALIARSGQCFRMREGKSGIVTALAGADRVRVTPLGGDRFRFDGAPTLTWIRTTRPSNARPPARMSFLRTQPASAGACASSGRTHGRRWSVF